VRADIEIRELEAEKLADCLLSDQRFRTRRCVEWYLDRCHRLLSQDPATAAKLAMLAPELVALSAGALGPDQDRYLVRAYSSAASALAAIRSFTPSDLMFEAARSHISPSVPRVEMAVLTIRQGHANGLRHCYPEALEALAQGVEFFRTWRGREREDCSLGFALVARATVAVLAYVDGESQDLASISRDLRCALEHAKGQLRLAALHGVGVTTLLAWHEGRVDKREIREVLRQVRIVQKRLPRERIPRRSMAHAATRWIEGQAIAILDGGLVPEAARLLEGAREHLASLEQWEDVARITLDVQWWLLQEGRWGRARGEARYLESLAPRLPARYRSTLILWHRAIASRELGEAVIRTTFKTVRGIPHVRPFDDKTDEAAGPTEIIGW